MSLSPRQTSPSKRPRLSLKINTSGTRQTLGRSSTALKADIDPSSPTAFNTLSNAYAVAIENASPRAAGAMGSITPKPGKPAPLRLETQAGGQSQGYMLPSQHSRTPGPFTISYPDTPKSAFPEDDSTPTTNHRQLVGDASACTFTPPQSAGSSDASQTRTFPFAASPAKGSGDSPRASRRRATFGSQQVAPYTHPRALHSILRNSPLPPRSSLTPTRSSLRIATRAGKKVEYNDPLTQTITTNKYVKSHIDLLDSPFSAIDPQSATSDILDTTMEYTGDETRDGGSTPGPFEEMRRRMAESGLETPARKRRRRKEKKRKWEWTITNTDETTEENKDTDMAIGSDRTPVTAIRVEKTPNTAIFIRDMSVTDSEMSEAEDPRQTFVGSASDSAVSQSRPGTSHSL